MGNQSKNNTQYKKKSTPVKKTTPVKKSFGSAANKTTPVKKSFGSAANSSISSPKGSESSGPSKAEISSLVAKVKRLLDNADADVFDPAGWRCQALEKLLL